MTHQAFTITTRFNSDKYKKRVGSCSAKIFVKYHSTMFWPTADRQTGRQAGRQAGRQRTEKRLCVLRDVFCVRSREIERERGERDEG